MVMKLVDHQTWVLASDGDLMEGISQEAASLAGHLQLDRLIILYDDNAITIDGETSLAFSEDTLSRFAACGWDVQRCRGDDPRNVAEAIDAALDSSAPSLIACRTRIGFGAPNKGGTAAAHGAPLGEKEIAATRRMAGLGSPSVRGSRNGPAWHGERSENAVLKYVPPGNTGLRHRHMPKHFGGLRRENFRPAGRHSPNSASGYLSKRRQQSPPAHHPARYLTP